MLKGHERGCRRITRGNEMGLQQTGKKAKIVMRAQWNTFCPICTIGNYLIFAAKAAHFDIAVIDGRTIIENRKLVKVDVEEGRTRG